MQRALDLYYLSLVLVIVTLPFAFLPNNIAIGALVVAWAVLITKSDYSPLREIKKNAIAIIMILFGLSYGVSALINPGEHGSLLEALRHLEVHAGFVLFPLTLSGLSKLGRQKIDRLLYIYVGTIVVTCLLCVSLATLETIQTGSVYHINPENGVLENHFTYHRLASWIGIHAVYLAAYVSFAFFICLVYLLDHYRRLSVVMRGALILILLFLAVMIFLLKSIAISVAFVVILPLLVLYYVLYRLKVGVLRLTMILAIFATLFALFSYRVLDKVNIKESLLEYDMTEEPPYGNWNPVNLRLAQWEVGSQIVTRNWLVGVGPGNSERVLKDYYEKNGFTFALVSNFNAHNQFLESFISLGIFGLLLNVLLYVVPFRRAWIRHDVIMLAFVSTFFLFSISESIFSVNKGVVFFTFFLGIFAFAPWKSETK